MVLWGQEASCVAVCYLTPFWVFSILTQHCLARSTSWTRRLQRNYMKEEDSKK